ncbi:HAD hydrolase-like protein [candidate division KSB1 bacterium]|nr:HAD hydrolase-like protein [candidate division KSB1 bacterium]
MNSSPKYNILIFDLDGTISDPSDGIIHSLNHTLETLGFASYPRSELIKYIGPGLKEIFRQLVSDEPAILKKAVQIFRQHYSAIGYRENVLYPHITDALHKLYDKGIKLFVATSKREDIANTVVRYFGLENLFSHVYGCGDDLNKSQLIAHILQSANNASAALYIGDRLSDLLAATENRIDTAIVTWGFASEHEFEKKQPAYFINHPLELIKIAFDILQ